jgi:hypothetical protein
MDSYVTSHLSNRALRTDIRMSDLIAERFPRPDLPERLVSIAPPAAADAGAQHSVRNADAVFDTAPPCPAPATEHSVRNAVGTPLPQPPTEDSPGNPPPPAPCGRMTPLSPQRFGFQFTGDQETHEEYEKFRARMSHEIPSGEMAVVFKAALKIANAQLEKRKFAATDRPGRSRGSASPRCIPADVKRAVAERDQGKCAFVSESGKRCGSRSMLEFDHIEPVGRGGTATVDNVRLLCRAHNQHEAERAFGTEFMDYKRHGARARRGAHAGTPMAHIRE